MKVKTYLLLTISLSYIIIIDAVRSPIYAPFHIISLKDITADERRQIAYIQQKLERAKRSGSSSGSGEIVNLLKTAIGNGIKKKVGQLAMASAAASGAFSKTSSNSGYHKEYYHHPPSHYPEEHHDHPQKMFDYWNLKKSILNTLLQAVKAIKGGVIAVKGQLVKGGGKLISASGHLVSSQGDAITHLGKKIATSAILVPWMGSSGNRHPHIEYESVENHYTSPSGPSEVYHHSPHSGPSEDYHVPDEYPPHHHEDTSGLLILRKVSGRGKVQEYNPSSINTHESSPSLGSVLGKLFSASSSLDPHKPELYGDRPTEHINSYEADFAQTNNNDIVPSASGVVKHEIPTQVKANLPKLPTLPHNTFNAVKESPSNINQHLPYHQLVENEEASQHFDETLLTNKPDDVPYSFSQFSKPTSFKEISKNPENAVKTEPQSFMKHLKNSQSNANHFQYSAEAQSKKQPFKLSQQYSELNDPQIYLSPPSVVSPIFSDSAPEIDLENNSLIDLDISNSKYSQLAENSDYSSSPSPYLETPKTQYNTLPAKMSYSTIDYKRDPSENSTSETNFFNIYNQFSHNYDVVPSISFELGPQGPKRLT